MGIEDEKFLKLHAMDDRFPLIVRIGRVPVLLKLLLHGRRERRLHALEPPRYGGCDNERPSLQRTSQIYAYRRDSEISADTSPARALYGSSSRPLYGSCQSCRE